VGKSRLAVEVARTLPEGWFAGQPDPARLDEAVERVVACGQPALLVVEDADWVAGLAGFLQRAAAAEGRVRVVLTSRQGPALLQRLRADPDHGLGLVLAGDPVLELAPVGDSGDRQRWYLEAVRGYAHVLRMPRPDVPGLAPVGRDGDTMLLLQARALLSVLNRPGSRTLGLTEIIEQLVLAEQQRWTGPAGPPAGYGEQPEAVAAVLGVLALLPAGDEITAAGLLRRLPQFAHDASQADRVALAHWAYLRYRRALDGWLDLWPHLVAEWLLLRVA
jgi:hypothetical protein